MKSAMGSFLLSHRNSVPEIRELDRIEERRNADYLLAAHLHEPCIGISMKLTVESKAFGKATFQQ
jgi:hypothetical protein